MSNRCKLCIATLLALEVVAGCRTTSPDTAALDAHMPAGIFLEPEDRAAPPPGVPLRSLYGKGLNVTKASEGFSPRLYNDVARYCTIGYGHLVMKAPCNGTEPPEFRNGLTEPKGANLLVSDMERAQRSVLGMVNVNLTDGQYAALCDFAFNVGPLKLRKSTLLKAVNARQFDRVPSQFLRWVNAGGREQSGLKTRREREIALFFDGIPQPKAAPPADENLTPIDIERGE